MELVPQMIDGAIVFNVEGRCRNHSFGCETCSHLSIVIHNWLKYAEISYVILDFMDQKDACPILLEELMLLRKRLRFPFLFVGVTDLTRHILLSYDTALDFPFFLTPEDAVRALRLQMPGLTEATARLPLHLGQPLTQIWRERLSEALGLV